jgi:hypothetical protein
VLARFSELARCPLAVEVYLANSKADCISSGHGSDLNFGMKCRGISAAADVERIGIDVGRDKGESRVLTGVGNRRARGDLPDKIEHNAWQKSSSSFEPDIRPCIGPFAVENQTSKEVYNKSATNTPGGTKKRTTYNGHWRSSPRRDCKLPESRTSSFLFLP